MSFESRKIELAKLVLSLKNPELIEKISSLIKSEDRDFWNDLSEREKQEIELGVRLLKEGKRTSLEDFFKKVS